MKIILAETAGFCMGVRRAMDLVLVAAHRRGRPVFTEGPLIHNPQVVSLLEKLGVKALESACAPPGSIVVLRAHGVHPGRRRELSACLGVELVDATCPLVKQIQEIGRRARESGRPLIVVGDHDHPEVLALLADAGGNGRCLSTIEEARSLPVLAGAVVVAQSTQDVELYQRVTAVIREKIPGADVRDTICRATRRRQEEVRELCRQADAVVVVGGGNSANTRRLAEIVAATGKTLLAVETDGDLDLSRLAGCERVGVTAGASTPSWMILRVVRTLEALAGQSGGRLRRSFLAAQEFLVNSYLFLATGAAGLALAGSLLQGIVPPLLAVLVAALFIYSMHVLNHYTDPAADFSDPRRSALFRDYRGFLVPAGITALGASLVGAFQLGPAPFTFLCACTVLGALYNVPLVSGRLAGWMGGSGLKDFPGSRDLAVALAWGLVIGLLPALTVRGGLGPGGRSLTVAGLVAAVLLARLLDSGIAELQGDRLVGKETIPVLIGERAARRLTILLPAAVGLALALLAAAGHLTSFAWWLLPAVAWLLAGIEGHRRSGSVSHPRFGAVADISFWLSGLAGLLWLLLGRQFPPVF